MNDKQRGRDARQMKILAFDTSFSVCSAALQNGEQIQSLYRVAPMRHTQLILPMIQSLLDGALLALADLDAIVFGGGPGSFTGIRIATSVAHTLAYAIKLPVIRLSSLAMLAETAFIEKKCKHCLVAVKARKDEVYWAHYQLDGLGHMALVGEESLLNLTAVNTDTFSMREQDQQNCYAIGNAWQEGEDQRLSANLGFQPITYVGQEPYARALLSLARSKIEHGQLKSGDDDRSLIYLH